MCGLAGTLTFTPSGDPRAEIEPMTIALYHRGPDAGAVFVDEAAGVALGHRRLSILDLSEFGAQPMRSADGRFVLVFNGEIYNHLSLRGRVGASRAVDWRGHSDTETLVECFAAWGVEATLREAVGMFAVALWDRTERQLTLARDRFGEKPLYYGFIGRGDTTVFLFGSELKALRAHHGFNQPIDRNALALFLRYCYVPTPHTIYRDVYKLEPGSILHIRPDEVPARRRRVAPYWRYAEVAVAGLADPIDDERVAIDALEATLSKAVGLQLVADVPVGVFLSGGIDSATVAALMQAQSGRPVRTFSVGFDEPEFDEAPHAREVAKHLRTDHCEVRVTAAEALAVVPAMPTVYDEPFGDSSQIPTFLICAAARREVTVALSGDAGDEMFGGYTRYSIAPMLWRRIELLPRTLRSAAGRAAAPLMGLTLTSKLGRSLSPYWDRAYKLVDALGALKDADDLYRVLVTEWAEGATPVLGASPMAARLDDLGFATGVDGPVRRMMLFDGLTYLPDDILVKVDRAAMAVSLETRAPLLDHRVAELVWRLPPSMIMRDGRSKWALRQVLYRHVPPRLVERPKAGFTPPIGPWLRGPLRDWAEELLSERRLREEGYLDAAAVRLLWAQHRSSRRDWEARLWNILMFQGWLSSAKEPFAVASTDIKRSLPLREPGHRRAREPGRANADARERRPSPKPV